MPTETTEDAADNEAYPIENTLELSRHQLIAKTIAYSFTLNKGLVPTIAVSKGTLKIFMYHPEYDLLYEGSELSLFLDKPPLPHIPTRFDTRTIIALWLALNYDWFCSGVNMDHIEFGYCADFKSHVKDTLEIYKKSMNFSKSRQGTASELPYKAVKGQWQRCC